MTRVFDPNPIFDLLRSFWRKHYKDRKKLERFWEGFVRLMDDEYASIEQINDAGSVISCPSFIYHTYLYRKLEDWKIYGVPHRHFSKRFRASAGQTVFYLGAWVGTGFTQVFLHGKETDPLADPYKITFDQDSTQPGTNPSGARLIFQNPLSANAPVAVFSDREVARQEVEVTSSGLQDITFPGDVDESSIRVILKKINLTRFLDIQSQTFSWKTFPSGVQDTRIFRRGEVFEIVDGVNRQIVPISVTGQSVSIPTAVNPSTTKVYRFIDLDITDGKITMDGAVLRSGNQAFPPSSLVRVADFIGSEGIEVKEAASSIEYRRAYDLSSFKAFMYAGEITGGYTAADDKITFARSFMEGVVLVVEANLNEDNDHAEYRQIIPALTNQVTVPATRPFAITAGLLERPDYPVMLFIDGVLQPSDTYTFLSTITLQMNTSVIPQNSVVDLYYVDLEDPEPHLHVVERIRVDNPTAAFYLESKPADRYPRIVTISGVMESDKTKRYFVQNGEFLNFYQPLSSGSFVQVRGAKKSLRFYHDIDTEIVTAGYLQNGIDEKSVKIPGGWTVQLPWRSGFLITAGLLESDHNIENAWFVNAFVDERTGYNNFGFLVEFDRQTSNEYIRILRALFSGNYAGSQIWTIESLACILLGSEYLNESGVVDSISGNLVRIGDGTYNIDPEAGPRVVPSVEYGKYHAVSAMAEVVDDWDPFDEIALIASDFSDTYSYARTLDVHRDRILDGPNCHYDSHLDRIVDPDTDFFLEEVWPGDLLAVYTQNDPSKALYGRVIKVERHALQTTIVPDVIPSAYGRGRFGQWAFGVGSFIIPLDRYKIWVRRTDTLDVYRHLDEALQEDVPYLADRLHDLLSTFTFLVNIKWSSIKDGTALRDVENLIERLKPKEQRGIIMTRAFDGGLVEEVVGQVQDQEPTITEVPNYAFVSSVPEIIGIVGENGQISPNMGSFLGP